MLGGRGRGEGEGVGGEGKGSPNTEIIMLAEVTTGDQKLNCIFIILYSYRHIHTQRIF